jgi:hypothetical protein
MSAVQINPLNAELNPICHLLALLEAHHILHVGRIRVKTRSVTYLDTQAEVSKNSPYECSDTHYRSAVCQWDARFKPQTGYS